MTPRLRLACLLFAVAISGCGREYIDGTYGRQRLPSMIGSVNGTDVLASMFKDAGHDVYSRRTLVTDEMTAANTVVWFPNDTSAPRKEVCEWFDQWLSEETGRTLIFVGRDFDAEPQYWEFHYNRKKFQGKKADDAARNEKNERGREKPDKRRSRQAAKQDELNSSGARDSDQKHTPDSEIEDKSSDEDDDETSPECRWFTYEPGDKRSIRELSGPWADGIDASKTRIEVGTRLVPRGEDEVLLASEVGPFVSRLSPPYSDGSQIILVENGSFLLNLPLINHEHRKLAGELVASVGESGSVVFLESGPGGPPIDPPPTDSSLWTLFQGWPLGAILLQLAVAGIIFCFARWPIFGRPKQPAGAATTDFSYHVAAVGELLAKTRDPTLAVPPTETAPATAKAATAELRSSSSMFR